MELATEYVGAAGAAAIVRKAAVRAGIKWSRMMCLGLSLPSMPSSCRYCQRAAQHWENTILLTKIGKS
jgi:hypothetical protein